MAFLSWRRSSYTKLLTFAYMLLLSLLLVPSSIHGHVSIDARLYPSIAYNFQSNDILMPQGDWLRTGTWLAGRPYYYDGVQVCNTTGISTEEQAAEQAQIDDDVYPYVGEEISVGDFEETLYSMEDLYDDNVGSSSQNFQWGNDENLFLATPSLLPKVLVATFSYYGTQQDLIDIALAAKSIQAQFILLVLQDELPPHSFSKAAFLFWWNRKLPQLDQYLNNNSHVYTERMLKPFFIILPSSVQADFLNEYRRFWGMHDFVFDDATITKGSDVIPKVVIYAILFVSLCRWAFKGNTTSHPRTEDTQPSFQLLPFTSDDLGRGVIQHCDGSGPDHCAICLEAMPTGTSVCVLPCRHAFHPTCVDNWLVQLQTRRQRHSSSEEGTWDGTNNTGTACCCPLCNFDLRQHLLEHRAARQELPKIPQATRIRVLLETAWKRRSTSLQHRQVLLEQSRGEGGDLELRVEDTQNTNAARNTEVNLVV
jgi:RING-like zinc finger